MCETQQIGQRSRTPRGCSLVADNIRNIRKQNAGLPGIVFNHILQNLIRIAEFRSERFKRRGDGGCQTGNIGIQAITTVLIDDVKVTVEGESLVYPPILPLTDVSEKSFTAHWQEVRNADDYLFSLFRKQWLSDGDVTYKADFNDGTLPTEGFTFELASADPFGNDGPDGSQAIHLFNGDKIVTASNHAYWISSLQAMRKKL